MFALKKITSKYVDERTYHSSGRYLVFQSISAKAALDVKTLPIYLFKFMAEVAGQLG